MMDLDRFKEVNDSLGHDAGDVLLKEFGSRLQLVVREADTVARLGGDEFALLLVTDGAEDVASVIDRIKATADHPFAIRGLSIGIEISIGVANYPDDGLDVETLLRHADLAMYAAKQARSGHMFFDSKHDTADTVRLTLVSELRRAIKGNELVLHYQPKATLTTGEIASVEALVRWKHPIRGLIPPDEFIPLAQQTTLVKPLAIWVLDEAMRQCRVWEDQGLAVSMAVNISPRNLLDERFPDVVAVLLKKWSLWPSRIVLEITESAIVSDLRLAKKVLDRFAAMGIQISIDDFGTGYSSLSHLKNLPVHELKVDRSFIARMTDSEDDATIVRSTIELGKNLGLTVVAEGVETEQTWAELRALGCDAAQGYVLSRPLPSDELTPVLRRHAPAGHPAKNSAQRENHVA